MEIFKKLSILDLFTFQLYLLNAVDLGQFEGTVGKLTLSGTFCNNFHHLAARNDKVMTFKKIILKSLIKLIELYDILRLKINIEFIY